MQTELISKITNEQKDQALAIFWAAAKNGVENIQAAAYNGARTVCHKLTCSCLANVRKFT